MHIGSRVMATGAKFSMLGSYPTMIKSTKPVISITAVRTGCGKSQTTRAVVRALLELGRKWFPFVTLCLMVILMLRKCNVLQTIADLAKHKCTIEEMEEYEPHVVIEVMLFMQVLIMKQF